MKLPMGGVADVGVDAVLDRLDEEALQPSLMFAGAGGGSHCCCYLHGAGPACCLFWGSPTLEPNPLSYTGYKTLLFAHVGPRILQAATLAAWTFVRDSCSDFKLLK